MDKFKKEKVLNLIEQGKKCRETDFHAYALAYLMGENLNKWLLDCCDFLNVCFSDEEITNRFMRCRPCLRSISECEYNTLMKGLQGLYDKIKYM